MKRRADEDKLALFRALAGATRLALVEAVASGEASAGDLARRAGVSAPAASNALSELVEAGVLAVEARGRERWYSLRFPELKRFLSRADAVASLVAVARR